MNSMRVLKTFALLVAGATAIATASIIARKSLSASQPQERQLTVNVEQLTSGDGTFPVEMRCGDARSSALNRLDDFSCLVINNTSKKISALAVIYSVVIEGPKGESRETNLLTNDFVVHPDIQEARHLKLLPPGESRTLQPPGPVTFENGAVKRIETHIDYVEFEDKTSTGANTNGSKMITSMREGAARYKAWLVQQYKRNKMDEHAIAPLLEDSDLPKESNLDGDPDLAEGARLYRRIMRSVYATQGAAELKRYLNK